MISPEGCVNPDHLEPVTNRENAMRGMAPGVVAFRQNTCFKGHELSGDNLAIQGKITKRRKCRICINEYQRQWRERNKK